VVRRLGQVAGTRVEAGDGTRIAVVPMEYLVALTLVPVRPRDEADLAHLLADPRLDHASARDIVRHLGGVAARFLDKMARTAGRTDAPRDDDSPS
jgi:hypothetical protein